MPADGALYSEVAITLKVSEESIRLWVNAFLLKGVKKNTGIHRS